MLQYYYNVHIETYLDILPLGKKKKPSQTQNVFKNTFVKKEHSETNALFTTLRIKKAYYIYIKNAFIDKCNRYIYYILHIIK